MKKFVFITKLLTAFLLVIVNCTMINAQWQQTNGPYGGNIRCIASDGTIIFAGTAGGGMFLSTNNGTLWTAVNNGLTSTDIQSLAVNGINIFAGTYDGGVFLSTNNGTSWTAVNTGLTSTYVNSFAISGSNIFAGTSDGVFLSTNNGTLWTAVNNGLQNIYVQSLVISGINIFAGTYGGGVWIRPLNQITFLVTTSQIDVTCFGNNNGSVIVTAAGGTPPYTYNWSNGQTDSVATGLAAGTYFVTVADADTNSVIDSVVITEPTALNASITAQTNVSCFGGNNGSSTVTVTGGTPYYSPLNNNEDWEGTNTWTLVNGTQTNKWYIGTATSNGGTKSIYISNDNSSNVYTITSSSVVHFYKDFTFPAGATNITVKFDWKGYGESGYDFLKIFLVPTTTTPVAGTQLSSVQIGSTYNLQSNFAIATITGLDINAGTTKRLVFSWRNDASIGTQPPAAIDNIIISYNYTGSDAYSYLWSNWQSGTHATGLTAGTYTVTVTDANLCTTTATITEPPPIILTITTTNATCGNDDGSAQVTATGGTPPYTYQWTSGALTNEASDLYSGTYVVTVTGANGCSGGATALVSDNGAPVITVETVTNINCYGNANGAIDISITGGMTPYTIEWSNGATSEDISGLIAAPTKSMYPATTVALQAKQ
ncbi:MAG: SprB repeat-containing protein [Bacteroidia bacterium]|nr:SprB repeat-containing protein [Bacteroidia bacterium]